MADTDAPEGTRLRRGAGGAIDPAFAGEAVHLRGGAAPLAPRRQGEPAGSYGVTSRRRALTVSELTERIQGVLETELFDVWVEGEVSNLKVARLGALVLLAQGRQGAQMRAVVWRPGRPASSASGRTTGCRCWRAVGSASIPPRGEYQLSVQVLEPLGKGSLQQAFEELKEKLEREGLFDAGAQAAAADAAALRRRRELARPAR